MRKTTWRVICPVHREIGRLETDDGAQARPDNAGPWLCWRPSFSDEAPRSSPCRFIVAVEPERRRRWWPW